MMLLSSVLMRPGGGFRLGALGFRVGVQTGIESAFHHQRLKIFQRRKALANSRFSRARAFSMLQQRSDTASYGNDRPLLKFGLISDVQYADIEDGASFSGTPRYYRHALQAAGRAAVEWERFIVCLSLCIANECTCSLIRLKE